MASIKTRLDGHFVACSAVAAAAAMGGVAQNADAAIVHSGAVNLNVASTTNGLYLNVVTGQINEPGNTGGASVPGWDINPYSSGAMNMFNNSNTPGGTYIVGGGTGLAPANMPAGSPVGAAGPFGGGVIPTTGTFPFNLNSSNNLVGFRFVNEANGNQVHYGWFRVSLAGTTTAQPRAVVEYAYEDVAGAAIPAGAIPAPGSLALLALGAAGLMGRRRK
jgi:hypothetical protein